MDGVRQHPGLCVKTYGEKGEVVAQHGAQGYCCSHIHLGELGRGHLALGALTQIDGTQ